MCMLVMLVCMRVQLSTLRSKWATWAVHRYSCRTRRLIWELSTTGIQLTYGWYAINYNFMYCQWPTMCIVLCNSQSCLHYAINIRSVDVINDILCIVLCWRVFNCSTVCAHWVTLHVYYSQNMGWALKWVPVQCLYSVCCVISVSPGVFVPSYVCTKLFVYRHSNDLYVEHACS